MEKSSEIKEYIQSFLSSKRFRDQIVYHTLMEAEPWLQDAPKHPWPAPIAEILRKMGIRMLYQHQIEAIDRIRSGRHVVVATATASGKTLIYNLPAFEKFLKNPDARALYVFPMKALAQDQLRVFNEMADSGGTQKPNAAIYDGDTTAWHRRRIRENPPNVILTNPEMMHLSFLPFHSKWSVFLSNLEMVVIDEVHTYRGIMGSHMAQVLRRLIRICAHYGAAPTFVFSSATVGNPGQLASMLTGLNVKAVTRSRASQGRRHVVFINPVDGPVRSAILLLKAALHRGLRTIVYTQSRKLTELLALWAGSKSGPYADRISAYRSGFLPEERRRIESKLSSGELLAVISTSALELGIDIGHLDLCILVGYPGSVMATWQRSGRVGRSGRDAALILIAGEDALDQYFMRYPQSLMKMAPEDAVVNAYNPDILKKHLVCAAAERPLKRSEPYLSHTDVEKEIRCLIGSGELLESADGRMLYAGRLMPHRHVDLRGAGVRFNIQSTSGKSRGQIDGFRAFKETHPGAIYLHQGVTYQVDGLDPDTRIVRVSRTHANYYTKARGHKDTEILDGFRQETLQDVTFCFGRLKVTDQVTGYEKWQLHKKQLLNIIPLTLPPLVFETEGMWMSIPLRMQQGIESRQLHFLGGIHAVEHAVIGVFPLLVLADRNDLGGIAVPMHPQLGSAAVFIYDAVPGGAGLTRQAFLKRKALFSHARDMVRGCSCESGCPSCVHSPKCGSGNRPIDKASALFILDRLTALFKTDVSKSTEKTAPLNAQTNHPDTLPAGHIGRLAQERRPEEAGGSEISGETGSPESRFKAKSPLNHLSPRFRGRLRGKSRSKWMPKADRHPIVMPVGRVGRKNENPMFGVFDLETRRSAQEVGGWHHADQMGISCAVLYDSRTDAFLEFLEEDVPMLVEHLGRLELVVGFNTTRFDYRVLSGYTNFDFRKLQSLDILSEVHRHLGYRLPLDHLARITLGAQKTADGLQALRWWKQGRLREIIDYCKKDVLITRDLYLYGKTNGFLLFRNKAEKTVRIPVDW